VPKHLWLDALWLLPLGLFVGAFGTLIGAGGGFILVPVLLLLYPNEAPATITTISLIVVFFNAVSGSIAYARTKRIDLKTGAIFALAAVPGSIYGAFASANIERQKFDLVFGLLLTLFSILLIIRPARNIGAVPAHGSLTEAPALSCGKLTLGALLSVGLGFISSFLGIGAGFIYVPAFIYLLDFPVLAATATSLFILSLMSLTGAATHIFAGMLDHGINLALLLTPGVVVGAQIGARLSRRIHTNWILHGLAVALGVVGLRFVIAAWK